MLTVSKYENLQGDANKMEDTLLKEIKELQKKLDYHKIEIFTNLKYAKGKSRYDDYYYNDNEYYVKLVANHIKDYLEIYQEYMTLLKEINDDFTEDCTDNMAKIIKRLNMQYKLSGKF